MHCNLRPPEPRQSFPALITTPCQVWRRWTYPLAHYSVFAADTLLYAVTLTFDLESLQRIVCDVMKFERNRTIRGGVIAILVFDLMTLNIALRVAFGSRIIFTKFDLWQLIRAWIIAFLCWCVMSRCDLDLWSLDLELLQHFGCHAFKLCTNFTTKFERNRIIHRWSIYWRFSTFSPWNFRGRARLTNGLQGCVDHRHEY